MKDLHIIKILSDSEFVIDGGKMDDLKLGDEFEIRGSSDGDKIIDLDGHELGFLGTKKGSVSIVELHDNFSLVKTRWIPAQTVKNPFGNSSLSLHTALSQGYVETQGHYESLNVNPEDVDRTDDDYEISVGDVLIKKKV
ncbi:hypothetical protein HZF13_05395 [Lactiplantibacillus plantarum]|uniref:hypothetical protein n=1 Tax=Lactiplantibacillus plantarum TaxID=1590 RepID=UPI001CA4A29C|nr:hypothetical protein [Lactiplantibacillus plantarum]QYC98876.1 hypothetical protein HZF13_05395 [Lactiplantibacillus plantarum]